MAEAIGRLEMWAGWLLAWLSFRVQDVSGWCYRRPAARARARRLEAQAPWQRAGGAGEGETSDG
jgi:hypothetical protein